VTRDQMLVELAVSRATFDNKVASLPRDSLREELPGYGRSVAQLVAHVSAFDRLVVQRLASADRAAMTSLAIDHGDYERHEQATWTFADTWRTDRVLERAKADFESLTLNVRNLSDDELNGRIGSGGVLDPAWLRGRAPWQAIAADTFEHYREHLDMLDEAWRRFVAEREQVPSAR